MRIALFAALGVITGVVAVELIDLLSGRFSVQIFPGLVFGVLFGLVLYRLELLRLVGAGGYLVASTLSHAAAVYLAIAMLNPVESIFGHDDNLNFAVIGLVAGSLGGGLLGGASAFLVRLSRWPLLIVAGAALGALLPLTNLMDFGEFVFYAVWQAGYAATLAAILSKAGRAQPSA